MIKANNKKSIYLYDSPKKGIDNNMILLEPYHKQKPADKGFCLTKRERIASLNRTLDLYLSAIEEAGPAAAVVSYTYSDSDGNQSVQRRPMSEMVKAVSDLQNLIDSLEKSLNRGGGLHTFDTRRII
jgi:hypothetical protein